MALPQYNFIKKISDIKSIEEIWLFGSRARGDNTPRSDIDLYIIAPKAGKHDIAMVESIIEEADTFLNIDITWDQKLHELVLKEQIMKYHIVLYNRKKMNYEVLKLKLQSLEKSLARYKDATKMKKTDIVRDSVIQRFEFTFELFWKVLKKILSYEGEETTTPRDTLSKAYQYNLIDNEKLWLDMMKDRNKTSHMYDEQEANIIYDNILVYCTVMEKSFTLLRKKYLENGGSNNGFD